MTHFESHTPCFKFISNCYLIAFSTLSPTATSPRGAVVTSLYSKLFVKLHKSLTLLYLISIIFLYFYAFICAITPYVIIYFLFYFENKVQMLIFLLIIEIAVKFFSSQPYLYKFATFFSYIFFIRKISKNAHPSSARGIANHTASNPNTFVSTNANGSISISCLKKEA